MLLCPPCDDNPGRVIVTPAPGAQPRHAGSYTHAGRRVDFYDCDFILQFPDGRNVPFKTRFAVAETGQVELAAPGYTGERLRVLAGGHYER